MSSYIKNTKNPKTGEFEPAMWLDDYFGHHHYGVMWQGGGMVDPERVKLETNDEPVDATFDSFDTQGIEHSEQSRKQSQDTASLLQSNQVDAVDEILTSFREHAQGRFGSDREQTKAKFNALLVAAQISENKRTMKLLPALNKHTGASWSRGYVSAQQTLRKKLKDRIKELQDALNK